MKIFEVTETDDFSYIKDLLVYLNIKNIPTVSTNSVIKELEKLGVSTDFEELQKIIKDLDFVDDINKNEIVFKSDKVNNIPSKEKKDMSKETVATMAKRARRRRET